MDLTGMIFKVENKEYSSSPVVTEYWLIIGPANPNSNSYPAVKCSASGKAYKATNGFSTGACRKTKRSTTAESRARVDYISSFESLVSMSLNERVSIPLSRSRKLRIVFSFSKLVSRMTLKNFSRFERLSKH